jgi:hypothetical protein
MRGKRGKTAGIFNRTLATQRIVPAVIIVFHKPVTSQVSDLLQIPEYIHIQNVLTKTPVKTFDITVLLRFARLNTPMTNPVTAAELSESMTGKLRPVVTADISGKSFF